MTQTLSAAYIGSLGILSVGSGTGNDYTSTTLEPLIDQAIDVVNQEAGIAVAHLSGTAGSKTSSVSDGSIGIVALMSLILGINAKLSREETTWSIERRNNLAEMIGANGALTRRYEALLQTFKTAGGDTSTSSGIAFTRYTESEDEET
jgi:hypothetical protein